MPFKNSSPIINNYVQVTQSAGSHSSLTDLDANDHLQYTLTSSFLPVSTSHALVSASHALVSSAYVAHAADATIHFTEASIDHDNIQNNGTFTHADIDTHINLTDVHFSQSAIDHTAIQNVGSFTHADIDTHINLAGVHFSQSAIDHTAIQNVGTFTHDDIDTHINLTDVHFSQSVVTDLSSALASRLTTDEADIASNSSAITTLSTSVAADVTSLRWIANTLDSSGDRTLSDSDNNTVIYMSGASANILRVPPTLTDGFHVVAHQASAFNIQVIATNSLSYPSTTFTSRSLEEGASIALHSGSFGIILGGILEGV